MAAFQPDLILFWIALMLSPADASQILVQGPDFVAAWTRQDAGWSYSADRSIWSVEGSTIIRTAGGKAEKTPLGLSPNDSQVGKHIKEHDWQKSPKLKLSPTTSLGKNGKSFVFTWADGTPDQMQYKIQYRRNSAAKPGSNTVRPAATPGSSWADLIPVETRQQVERLFSEEAAPQAGPKNGTSGSLGFYVVPNPPGSKKMPAYPEFVGKTQERFAAAAVKELTDKGPEKARPCDGEFRWFELAIPDVPADALTSEHSGKKYILLCAREPHAMLPATAENAWRLEQVAPSKDGAGFPQIHFRFDRRGGDLFRSLTKANVGNRLATVVGGRVMSAPTVHSEIHGSGAITGRFTEQEVQEMLDQMTGEARPAGVEVSSAQAIVADLKSGNMGAIIRATQQLMRTRPKQSDREIAKALEKVLLENGDVSLRINAAKALENWGTPESVAALKKAAEDRNPILQSRAKMAIEEIQSRK